MTNSTKGMPDFEVSEKRRNVWNIQLELLEELKKVCKKHNLTYFAFYGALLGAMRHKGFIPWDDDIDVAMKREDYEKLCKIGPEEFKGKFFFQDEKTDNGYFYGHAKIRNSETTAIRKANWKSKQKFNQGIFLDIFPMDYVPDDDNESYAFEKKMTNMHRPLKFVKYWYVERDYKGIKNKIRYIVYKTMLAIVGDKNYFAKYKKALMKYDGKKTNSLAIISELSYENKKWKASLFDEMIEVPFENTSISVPKEYDEILSVTYKNWRVPVKAATGHGDVFYDCKQSYKNYLDKYEQYLDDSYYDF